MRALLGSSDWRGRMMLGAGRAVAGSLAVVLLAACGSDTSSDASSPTTVEPGSLTSVPADRPLAGSVRSPLPDVDVVALPRLVPPEVAEGESLLDADPVVDGEARFVASDDKLKIVYFGYTNCPDICPTTMFDAAVAIRKLPPELAARVELLMVSIDPDRDLPVLSNYVRSFVDGAEAAGTTDLDLLDEALAPFGASYSIEPDPEGGEPIVEHSTLLYVVDDAGRLLVTWPFGLPSDAMAADLVQLLTHGTEG